MATYAIGDIQGCFLTLQKLLKRCAFDPQKDRLWLVGDLVNRGPRSLEVLRWLVEYQSCVTAVLGNHDLHLLARSLGVRKPLRRDTLASVLRAPDRDLLLGWLRQLPLLHRENGYTMVHAGLLPQWTPEVAQEKACALQREVAGEGITELLSTYEEKMFAHSEMVRALVAFTRMRSITLDGRICLKSTGQPDSAPRGCLPWFALPDRQSAGETVVFGHWAALGLMLQDNLIGLDSGCVWGRELTAIRLEDRALFQEKNCE